MTKNIVFLPGDGIGPEVALAAQQITVRAANTHDVAISIAEHDFGGAAIDAHGTPLPAKTLDSCLAADAVFLGAVGGPKWDGGGPRPESGLLDLRKAMDVYANLRPLRVLPGMEAFSPLKEERAAGVDIIIIRELTGGVYFGKREEGEEQATDECLYTCSEVKRIARIAFETARGRSGRVASVDKANVMATGRLWRNSVSGLHRSDYSNVELEHVLVDAMAMKLIQHPRDFDVILTENMFGDILSDEASVIAGSIGLSPSASLGDGKRGLYEPIHGSAPDIAGQDKANPIGAILSAAMMFRHSLDAEAPAAAIECAVTETLAAGARGFDLGGTLGCEALSSEILARI